MSLQCLCNKEGKAPHVSSRFVSFYHGYPSYPITMMPARLIVNPYSDDDQSRWQPSWGWPGLLER